MNDLIKARIRPIRRQMANLINSLSLEATERMLKQEQDPTTRALLHFVFDMKTIQKQYLEMQGKQLDLFEGWDDELFQAEASNAPQKRLF